ncbi:MAG: site-2 protease family protein [Acidobacteriota bacterium]
MMLQFRLFGFPVAVQPFFLITAWLIGPRGDLQATVLWIVTVFVGIMAHELGHAFAGRHFNLDPVITLHAFGGMTSWRGDRKLGNGQRILLSAAGPAVGIVIGLAALILAPRLLPDPGIIMSRLIHYTVWVNLGWGVLNLAPVLPLDGGHIAASAAEAAFGKPGRTVAAVLSLILTAALALWAMWNGEIWLTILAVVLAVSNIQSIGWFKSKDEPSPAAPARSDALRSYDLARGLAQAGQHDEAIEWLEVAVKSGFSNGAVIDADPAWSGLRNERRFVDLRRSL